MKILFTSIGRRVELIQAFKNASKILGLDLTIYGADVSNTAPALFFCDRQVIVCKIKDKNYISSLLKICGEEKIDALIPTIDTDLIALSQNIKMFESFGTKVFISAENKIKICRDKMNTAKFFDSIGLKTPVPVDDYKKYNFEFPAFIKPKDGSSSINAYKVNDKLELEMYAKEVQDYIIAPYIEGTEYTIDALCDYDGNPILITPRVRLAVRAGEVLKTQIVQDEKIIEEAKKIIDAFKPCGPITIQLIRQTSSGNDFFIEINPRFGGGAPLSIKAGADSALMLLRLIRGDKLTYLDKSARDGSVYSRYDQSVCVFEEKHCTKGVIFDLDDTLYSEKDYIKSGFKAVSDYLGVDYEEELWNFFLSGMPAIDELLKKIGRIDCKDRVLSIYRSHTPNIHLYDGVIEIINNLKNRGIKVGIITDGRPEGQRKKLEALGINVDDVIITDELGGVQFRKPCDISFRIMQTRWKLNMEEIVYVADNPSKDFQAPQQLGIRTIYFNNFNGIYNEKYDIPIETIFDIKELKI